MGGDALIAALSAVNEYPKRLQSDFARTHSWAVARLASCGLITTALRMPSGEVAYGHLWRCTWKGLRVLELSGVDTPEE